VSRTDFGSDQFKGFKGFIAALPEGQATEACRRLLSLRREFSSRAAAFRVTRAELERRPREAERQAIAEQQAIIDAYQRDSRPQFVRLPSGRIHRITRCYNCTRHLDNAVDVECPACGWIVCPCCGACGSACSR
jgi:hypothetical protein